MAAPWLLDKPPMPGDPHVRRRQRGFSFIEVIVTMTVLGIVLAMAISGALAGMVGINEVLGYRYRYYDGFSANYGFTGIAVALLGRNHPLGILIAAIFFAVLKRGEIFVDIETKYVSKDLVEVLQAIIILFVASLQRFSRK